LLIVIAILAVLAGAMIPLFKSSKQYSQYAKIMADLDVVKSAAVLYKFDTGAWPPESFVEDDTGCLITTGVGCPTAGGGWNGPYLTGWVKANVVGYWIRDVWDMPYRIVAPGGNKALYAQCGGADRVFNDCNVQCGYVGQLWCDFCIKITDDRTK